MSCTIEPFKNLIFNNNLYKFYKSFISTPQEQPIKTEPINTVEVVMEIKEEDKNFLNDEHTPERPIISIDYG